jgi:hypothetical protein
MSSLTKFVLHARCAWAEVKEGKTHGFRRCCRLHYGWSMLLGWPPATLRGAVIYGECNEYVPCALCKRFPSRWRQPKLHAPGESPHYETWAASCATYGISVDRARRYKRRGWHEQVAR